MKKSISLLSLAFILLAGCSLEDSSRGISCPPASNESNLTRLEYISTPECKASSLDKCSGSDVTDANFNFGYCPISANGCILNMDNDNYHCGDCDGMLNCDGECIDSANPRHCGAIKCKLENFGGKDCKSMGEYWGCIENNDNTYECGCKKGAVYCNENCINPMTDAKHCGATGKCTSELSNDTDFAGWDCESAGVSCVEGKCKCSENQKWCSIAGTAKCYDPSDAATCGINDDCEYTACKENEHCGLKDGTYKCLVDWCAEEYNKCMVDNEYKCLEKTDISACGSCDKDCTIRDQKFAHGVGCSSESEHYQCMYMCDDKYSNCGDSFNPQCFDLQNDSLNCGQCGNLCPEDKICNEGICIETTCQPNQCTQKKGNGVECVNTSTQCGKNCENCSLLVKTEFEESACNDGICQLQCKAGSYPVYSGSEVISCQKTSVTACAPADMTSDKTPVNCTTQKPANADSMTCPDAGTCQIVSCVSGYHLSEDKTSCIKNTDTECAPTNSSVITNCNTLVNTAKGFCDEGICKISECQAGYHIAPDQLACTANSNTECAPVTSSNTVNCENEPLTKFCNPSGECACDAEGKLALNFDKTNCIIAKCATFTGAKESTCNNDSSYRCIPTTCVKGYHANGSCNSGWGACTPQCSKSSECSSFEGWKSGTCNSGNCVATSCKDGYRFEHNVCLSIQSCCGSDCKNCTARGMTCPSKSDSAECK